MADLKIGDKVSWREGDKLMHGMIVDVQTVTRTTVKRAGREIALPRTEWIVEDENGNLYSRPSELLSFGEN